MRPFNVLLELDVLSSEVGQEDDVWVSGFAIYWERFISPGGEKRISALVVYIEL